ncbi:MAG TPA: hypothetical protein VKV28_12375 [Candidatus Binataceae bacterium]|nr:hypothetical protein [Candidatus Binataceae bacterium]
MKRLTYTEALHPFLALDPDKSIAFGDERYIDWASNGFSFSGRHFRDKDGYAHKRFRQACQFQFARLKTERQIPPPCGGKSQPTK